MNFLGSKEQMKASRGLNGLASQKVFIALHFVLFVGKQSFRFSLTLRRLGWKEIRLAKATQSS